MNHRPVLPLVLVVVLGVLASGCGGDAAAEDAPTAGVDRVAEATLEPGEEVPAPTEEVVLTLSGAIGTTNVGDELQLDMPTLEAMGLVAFTVDDDQAEGRRVTFTGVELRTLLDVADIDPAATELEMTALNDYIVSVPVADADASPVLVATQSDGQRMPVANYGPLRIVYPYDSYDLNPTIHDPRWIWQLVTIDVS